MQVLFVIDVIHAGGAETFVLRLGQALSEKEHQVIVYPLYKGQVDFSIVNSLAPDVQIIPAKIPLLRWAQIIDGFLFRLKLPLSLLRLLFARHLRQVIKKQGVQLLHSHLFTADEVAVAATRNSNVPVVTTIHGDYSANDVQWQAGTLRRIPQFRNRMIAVLDAMKAIVCISEEQLGFFNQRSSFWNGLLPVRKIYNGYRPPTTKRKESVNRSQLQIPVDAFVFCMVARGIAQKGWKEVIEAFEMLGNQQCYLMLIGDSPYVQQLKGNNVNSRILFVGKQEQPFNFLCIADVGLFCSMIKTEALPTVIMEYLAAKLPVISTDVGEARLMLQGEIGMAGVLISPEVDELPMALTKAMASLAGDTGSYSQLKEQSVNAFAKFNMDHCVEQYEQVYQECIDSSKLN